MNMIMYSLFYIINSRWIQNFLVWIDHTLNSTVNIEVHKRHSVVFVYFFIFAWSISKKKSYKTKKIKQIYITKRYKLIYVKLESKKENIKKLR